MHWVLIAAEGEKQIVRLFRMPAPSVAELCWFLVFILVFAVGFLTALAAGRRRERLRRRAAEEEGLRQALADAGLKEEENKLFEIVTHCSRESALRCATLVEVFDRGVQALLRVPAGKEERLGMLRTLRGLRRKLGLNATRRGVPLSSSRALPRNQPVVVIPPAPRSEDRPVLGTLVVVGEDSLTIRLEGPCAEAALPLRGQAEVEVVFFRPGDAAYSFRAAVVGLRELDAAFLVLAHPDELTRIQKRRHARIDLQEEVRYRWIPEARLRGAPGPVESRDTLLGGQEGVVLDVSGSGLKLRTGQRLSPGDVIVLTLPFLQPPLDAELCSAKVIQVAEDGTYGLSFEGLAPRMQAAIVQFVRRLEVEQAAEQSADRS